MKMSCSLEVVEFVRPDGNRKNLYITGLPGIAEEDILSTLHYIFSSFGPVYGIQLFPASVPNTKLVSEPDTSSVISASENHEGSNVNAAVRRSPVTKETTETDQTTTSPVATGSSATLAFYAFVTFYLAMTAKMAREELKCRLVINGFECKISYAKRKKESTDDTIPYLHFTKCEELANYYLGFNGWMSSIKLMELDSDVADGPSHKVRYVCVVRLDINGHFLFTDGMGAWEDVYMLTDPASKAKAICKCKKLSYQRAIVNAFSKVILIVLSNGKVTVEVDTTRPELRLSDQLTQEEGVLKVNEIDAEPESEDLTETLEDGADMDDINLHILHELEEGEM